MRALRIATCRVLPEPDTDEPLLLAALAARGVAARMAAWDDPEEPWDEPVPTVVRSTWNYHLDPDGFRAWIDRVAARASLWNPAPVLRGNVHKGYLLDLARRGIPVAPTVLLPRGDAARLAEVMDARGWDEVVVKPAISCASFATRRGHRRDLAAAEAHLAGYLPLRDMLVQQFVPSVEGDGERAVVWIDGELTHAVRKSPRLAGQDEAVSGAVPIAPAERELAEAVLRPMAASLLYARVDMAPDRDGRPLLMELELMEPSLFLDRHPPALERLADALAVRVP